MNDRRFRRLWRKMERWPAHRPRGFYTDKRRGRIMGVCAGMAHRFDTGVTAFRVGLLLCLFVFQMWFLAPVYVILGFVLGDLRDHEELEKEKKERNRRSPEEARFHGLPPHLRFQELRRRLDDLERRAGGMEREATSRESRLKRAFRNIAAPTRPPA